jgi:hypothetical protein
VGLGGEGQAWIILEEYPSSRFAARSKLIFSKKEAEDALSQRSCWEREDMGTTVRETFLTHVS